MCNDFAYKQVKKWIHVSGDLDENVTMVNLPFVIVASEVSCYIYKTTDLADL